MAANKRMKYDAEFKRELMEYAKVHGNHATARKYYVNESMVRQWRKNAAVIENMPSHKCALRSGKAQWPALDKAVARWVLENRRNGVSLTRNRMREFAMQWAKDNASESENFKATPGWCDRFLKRECLLIKKEKRSEANGDDQDDDGLVTSTNVSFQLKDNKIEFTNSRNDDGKS